MGRRNADGARYNGEARSGALKWMLPEPDVQFVAVCDARKEQREAVKKMVDTYYGNSDWLPARTAPASLRTSGGWPTMRLCSVLLLCFIALFAPSVRAMTAYPLPTLYVHDLNYASSLPAAQRYDLRHAAACIQGLTNRDAPRVFIKFNSRDDEWLTRLRESGGLCEGWPIQTVASVDELLSQFRQHVNGVVLYDPDPNAGVISTSLAATTAAGCEGAVALRKDPTVGSLYWHWVLDPLGPRLPVLLDLSARFSGTGSLKKNGLTGLPANAGA